jgi:hypothetical protein
VQGGVLTAQRSDIGEMHALLILRRFDSRTVTPVPEIPDRSTRNIIFQLLFSLSLILPASLVMAEPAVSVLGMVCIS